MGKTHIFDQGGIKPGDVVKLVTNLSVEDQMAVDSLRKLGDQGILDQRAALLMSLANEAKEKANQKRILDQHPHLVPALPVERSGLQFVQLVMLSIVLCSVIVLAVAQHRRKPEQGALPSSVEATAKPALLAPEDRKQATRSQKARAVVTK